PAIVRRLAQPHLHAGGPRRLSEFRASPVDLSDEALSQCRAVALASHGGFLAILVWFLLEVAAQREPSHMCRKALPTIALKPASARDRRFWVSNRTTAGVFDLRGERGRRCRAAEVC